MTEMLYYSYEGNFLMECDAEIIQCVFINTHDGYAPDTHNNISSSSSRNNNNNNIHQPTTVQLVLDKTVLHAQGGGQPTDRGTIQCGDAVINVTKVLLDRTTNVATHTGTIDHDPCHPPPHHYHDADDSAVTNAEAAASISVGDKVKVFVDKENRLILSECHTAGHVIDAAMAKCGMLPRMETLKAYHFLDAPFVEYKGKVSQDELGPLLQSLQAVFQELLEEDIPTEIVVLDKGQAQKQCDRVKENYFNLSDFGDEPVRLVTVAGWTCPCGGTHVKSTGPLMERKWGITGLKYKKGVLKIKYNQNWEQSK